MSEAIDKISKLLRQAESATGPEAEAFMERAQKLATQEGIALAIARQHQAKKEQRSVPVVKKITTGEKGKHGLAHFVQLALGIARANNVNCDIARNSTYVIAYGFESDIEVVEALFGSLMFQLEEATRAYIKSGVFKNETVERFNERTWQYESKPLHGSAARNNFQDAYVNRIASRLLSAKLEAEREAVTFSAATENVAQSSSSVEIVLRSKEVEVRDFYQASSRARGSWKGNGGSKSYSTSAREAGRSAADRANLGNQKALGGSRTAISR